ncbi:type I restriction endonuclease subunit R [Trichloromonas sp.]|uniref:type I restriction endonuclease subunit R n=1 Tax=Trichloromonas sp. TaxID=3069249 RepID=UPI002A3953AE|nr:type I restriction endonuclease subunit R [Trichloromonas sp.]
MPRKDYSEDILIQQPTAELLEQVLNYDCVFAHDNEDFGPESLLGRLSDREVVLRREVDDALRRLNPGLPDEAYQEALAQVTADDITKPLVQMNEDKYRLLRDGVPVKYRDETGQLKERRLKLVDFDDPANPKKNHFLVVRELWVQGRLWRRRPDVICYVNGLPLVFIELKRYDQHVDKAFKKNYSDYLDTIPHLFHWNALILISNGVDAKYGSITSIVEHFSRWKRLREEDPEPAKDQPLLPMLLRGMLDKATLLDLVENFILFDRSEGEVQKIFARNHQYLGVNRVIAKLLSEEPGAQADVEAGRLGVFWHTQGSGKSYSMIFLTEKIHRRISAKYTFVVMTDRNELDEQIFGTYTNCGAATNKKAKARDGKGLEKLLKENHRYVFSLIHKFHRLVDEAYSPREDIIVISDEAHRTQYGRLAINMRKALPRAKFIGFTGTPLIDNAEKQMTKEVFGDYISIYDFQRAVSDGATLPLFYENRGEKLEIIDPEINKRINDRIEAAKAAGDLDPEQEEKLYRDIARDYPILTSPTRLGKVAEDFVKHYHQRWQTGKAMMVCIDKITCVKMYDLITKEWQETWQALEAKVVAEEECFAKAGKTPDKFLQSHRAQVEWMKATEICVVISQEQGEVNEFRKWGLDIVPHREKMVHRDLDLEFKKPEHPFRVAIVCAMWLTGYDVKCLATLYLDKPMKGHTLMQAIARVNRVGGGKKNGLIIDYNGMLKSLRQALATFAQGDGKQVDMNILRDDTEALSEYGQSIKAAQEFLAGCSFNLDELIAATGFDKQALILRGVNTICETDELRKTFEVMAEDISARFRGLFPNPGLYAYDKQENAISALYNRLQESRETPDVSEMLQALYDVVDTAVTTDTSTVNETPIRYEMTKIDVSRLKAEFDRTCPNIKMLNLREKIEKRLQAMVAQNPTRVDLYERYQEIVAEYNKDKDAVEVQKVFDDLFRFNDNLDQEQRRYLREGLDNEDQLAVFDLLQKETLTRNEREKIKEVAKDLLKKLLSGKLQIDHWREKATAQAQVKAEIIRHLFVSLPGSGYANDEISAKAEMIFAHLYQTGIGVGAGNSTFH